MARNVSQSRDETTERQPLLSSPPLGRDRSDTNSSLHSNSPVPVINDVETYRGICIKLSASAFNFFLSGVAMATIGVMMPEFERHYSVNDTQAALVFPAGVMGYLLATSTAHRIQLRTGRRGIAAVSSASRLLFSVVLSRHPAFPFFLASFVGFGYGTGLTDTAWNSWAAGMSRPNVIQGILHGSFSAGCVAGPAIVTIVLRTSSWPLLYAMLACAMCMELVFQTWAFRTDTGTCIGPEIADGNEVKTRSLLQNHTLWICGAYYLVYQGIEASFTDWIVLFLIRTRHADVTTAAYASSIFWFGMAIGRYALGACTEWIGLRIAVFTYILVACCAQFLLMAVDQITGTLIVLGVCGFFLAPLFPSGIVMLSSQAAHKDRTKRVAALIAMGQIGGAIVPFGLGVIATHLGTQYLLHVTLSLSIVLLGLWAAVSRFGADVVAVKDREGLSTTVRSAASQVAVSHHADT